MKETKIQGVELTQPSIKRMNDALWSVIIGVTDKTMDPGEGDTIVNAAGKMIQGAALQLKAREMDGVTEVDLLNIPRGIQKRLQGK